MRRWEFVGDGSAKFWEAEAEGAAVTVRYGRVGAEGRTQVEELDSAEAARLHLAKVIAEKERKGYREISAEVAVGAAAQAAESAPVSPDEVALPDESVLSDEFVLPDEESFEVPAAWRRLVRPRRGGIRRGAVEPHQDAGEKVAGRLKEEAAWIEQMLSSSLSDARIVEAARGHLSGSPSPLGAAALASMTMHYRLPSGVFVDTWVHDHGLAFAARAVVEYFDIEAHWLQYGMNRQDPRLRFRPVGGHVEGQWARPHFADRMRALLAAADEDSYREAVAALAGCRDAERGRIVVSYLVPGEGEWVAECCTGEVVDDPLLREMLLCSIGSPEQLGHFGSRLHLHWGGWSMAFVATLAEGTGTAFAPMLDEGLDVAYGSDRTKVLAGALVELPSDDAFGILLARVEDKHRPPASAGGDATLPGPRPAPAGHGGARLRQVRVDGPAVAGRARPYAPEADGRRTARPARRRRRPRRTDAHQQRPSGRRPAAGAARAAGQPTLGEEAYGPQGARGGRDAGRPGAPGGLAAG
ncbi:WGR domain-containing protein [Streptomyces sp. NPDC002285]